MPVITRLERQKRNQERVNVYLDDEFAFGLHELDAAGLRKGQELSEADITELRHKDAINRAVDRGVQLLSYRPRSTHEIRQKLHDKDVPDAVIDAAIERLERLGYVNDREFARFWIENRTNFKPRGARALRFELRQKGVPDAIIGELLDDLVDEDEAAYSAAVPRARRFRGQTRQVFKQKVGSFLQRRGFGYSVAIRAIDRLIGTLEADDPTFFAEADL